MRSRNVSSRRRTHRERPRLEFLQISNTTTSTVSSSSRDESEYFQATDHSPRSLRMETGRLQRHNLCLEFNEGSVTMTPLAVTKKKLLNSNKNEFTALLAIFSIFTFLRNIFCLSNFKIIDYLPPLLSQSGDYP